MNNLFSKRSTNHVSLLQKTRRTIMLICTMAIIMSGITVSSCSTYDEEDTTIIGFLKINDLIEKKLSSTCKDEILKLNKDIDEYNKSVDNANFNSFFNLGFPTEIKDLDYDIDLINLFVEKYKTQDGKYDLKKLETDITTELWTYINVTYSDIIPAKAQNGQEGRYYTISELKEKYPDYANLEMVDFRPMELISTVENEKLFDFSLLSEGEINLRTLYIFYLYHKQLKEKESKAQSENSTGTYIDYYGMFAKHFRNGLPEEDSVIIKRFNDIISEGDSYYENNTEGFDQFLFDYYETDLYSGADLE